MRTGCVWVDGSQNYQGILSCWFPSWFSARSYLMRESHPFIAPMLPYDSFIFPFSCSGLDLHSQPQPWDRSHRRTVGVLDLVLLLSFVPLFFEHSRPLLTLWLSWQVGPLEYNCLLACASLLLPALCSRLCAWAFSTSFRASLLVQPLCKVLGGPELSGGKVRPRYQLSCVLEPRATGLGLKGRTFPFYLQWHEPCHPVIKYLSVLKSSTWCAVLEG